MLERPGPSRKGSLKASQSPLSHATPVYACDPRPRGGSAEILLRPSGTHAVRTSHAATTRIVRCGSIRSRNKVTTNWSRYLLPTISSRHHANLRRPVTQTVQRLRPPLHKPHHAVDARIFPAPRATGGARRARHITYTSGSRIVVVRNAVRHDRTETVPVRQCIGIHVTDRPTDPQRRPYGPMVLEHRLNTEQRTRRTERCGFNTEHSAPQAAGCHRHDHPPAIRTTLPRGRKRDRRPMGRRSLLSSCMLCCSLTSLSPPRGVISLLSQSRNGRSRSRSTVQTSIA